MNFPEPMAKHHGRVYAMRYHWCKNIIRLQAFEHVTLLLFPQVTVYATVFIWKWRASTCLQLLLSMTVGKEKKNVMMLEFYPNPLIAKV